MLPGVRKLAKQFDTTIPTIQRVLARLEAHDLVRARQGKGVRTLSPEAGSGFIMAPLWLEALSLQPERAAKTLGDFLGLRRAVATRMAVDHRDLMRERLPDLQALASDLIGEDPGLDDLVGADLALSDAFLVASGNVAARAIFSAVARLIGEVRWVAEALYYDLDLYMATNMKVWAALLGDDDNTSAAAKVHAALSEFDHAAVERFEKLLHTHEGQAE